MKKLLFVFLIGCIGYSCGYQQSNMAEDGAEDIRIVQLVSEPMAYENHSVRFEGSIGHICRHSGDKMRIVQPDDDAYSILVMLGEYASSFNPEFEGKNVVATGLVKTQVRNIDALHDHDHDHGDDHEEGHECASTEEAIARLKERGIDADIFVYVELTGFEIK